jgi:hypothetical protein
MAVLPRKRHLSPKASRALEFLANRPASVTVALLLARGFSRRMLLGLIRQGLATLTYEKAQRHPVVTLKASGRSERVVPILIGNISGF